MAVEARSLGVAPGRPRPRAPLLARRLRAGGRQSLVPALHGARRRRRRKVTARPRIPRAHGPRHGAGTRLVPAYGERITYWPVLEAVMDVAGIDDGSSRSWGGLARLKRIRVCAFVLSAPRAGDDPGGRPREGRGSRGRPVSRRARIVRARAAKCSSTWCCERPPRLGS